MDHEAQPQVIVKLVSLTDQWQALPESMGDSHRRGLNVSLGSSSIQLIFLQYVKHEDVKYNEL